MMNFLFTKTPLMYFVQSFWRDESFSYLLAKRNVFEMLTLTAKDFNPPLYYLILHFWIKAFGSSEIALRSLSLVFYWGTLYVTYLFMVDILKLSVKKSFIYLLLFLLNPFLTYYAFEARMYSMLAFFATLSFYAFYRADRRLYIFAAVAGLYTHYFMLFVVATQFIFSRKLFKDITKSVLIFIPWLVFVLIQKGAPVQTFWIDKPKLGIFTKLAGIVYSGFETGLSNNSPLIVVFSAFLMFLFAVGYRHKKLFWYLLLWSIGIPLVALIISFFKPIFYPRYLIFSTVGMLLLLIMVLERLPLYSRVFILFILVSVTVSFQIRDLKFRKKADIRHTVGEIKNLSRNKDVTYVTNELDFFDVQYYFYEDRVFIYGKSGQEIPAYVGKVLIPESKLANSLPVYPRKAFILTSPTGYEIQSSY